MDICIIRLYIYTRINKYINIYVYVSMCVYIYIIYTHYPISENINKSQVGSQWQYPLGL